jgi:hypothetical protein
MVGNVNDQDFYEEDEPVTEIVAAFKRGRKGKTRRPQPKANDLKVSGWGSTTTNPGTAAKVAHSIGPKSPAHIPTAVVG